MASEQVKEQIEKSEDKQLGQSQSASVSSEVDAGRTELRQRDRNAEQEQRKTDRPPTFTSRTFGRSADILIAAEKLNDTMKRHTSEIKRSLDSKSLLTDVVIADVNSKMERPNIKASVDNSIASSGRTEASPSQEQSRPSDRDPSKPEPNGDPSVPSQKERGSDAGLQRPDQLPPAVIDQPQVREPKEPSSDARPEQIKELEKKFAEEIARTGRIPEELKAILENPSSPNGVSIAKINELLKQMKSPYELQDQRGSSGEVSLTNGAGQKMDGYTPNQKEQPQDPERLKPRLQPEELRKLENSCIDAIANTRELPADLQKQLEGLNKEQRAEAIKNINKQLHERGIQGELEDDGVEAPANKPEGSTKTEQTQPGEQPKVGQTDTVADTPEARAELAKKLADQISKTGKIPKEIIDAFSGKGSPGGVQIDIETINRELDASGSMAHLTQSVSREGHTTLSIADDYGWVTDKWVFIKSEEFGTIASQVPLDKSSDGPPHGRFIIDPVTGQPPGYEGDPIQDAKKLRDLQDAYGAVDPKIIQKLMDEINADKLKELLSQPGLDPSKPYFPVDRELNPDLAKYFQDPVIRQQLQRYITETLKKQEKTEKEKPDFFGINNDV